ncbi:hypothetical protein UFOVP106_2 [uncultured Caudovirales phage]|uniref:Uncharacterized protein n=1 Tax=uncultured Caudovirales phage TaxID=2100421 RepID=A0A6J5L0I3_9CAUD|nr:hypothetical protein UFOVP106_2 [uncultured Caudovirales phage]
MPVFTDYGRVQPTSLNDILGPMRELQQYKQALQLNPLQLQKAQLELEQLQKLNPVAYEKAKLELEKQQETQQPEISRIQSLSRQQLGTEQPTITSSQEAAKQAQTKTLSDAFAYDKDYNAQINQKLGGFLNDKGLKGSPSEVLRVLKDAENEVKLLTKSDPEHELKTEARFAPLKNLVVSGKHANVEQALKNIIQSGITPTSQQSLQTPQLTTVGGAPATFTSATGSAAPLTINQSQTAPQGLPQGGPQGGPLPPGFGMPQGMPQGAQQGVTPTQMSLPYPVRKAGDIRPLAPNEDVDTTKGAAYRNSLTTRQTDLSTSRRNLDEVLAQADKIAKESTKFMGFDTATGTLGSLSRGYASVVGDPKYKQLSKDLANVQIANIQAQGGSMDTVAGQQLQKMANGDETYPPDVLKNIARRTYADVQNLDMQATAASKFAQKYGDNNLNAFKRMWSANADSKVFEAITIFENVKDKAERNKAINDLLGSNPQARQQFYNKYNNIKKLTETGEL